MVRYVTKGEWLFILTACLFAFGGCAPTAPTVPAPQAVAPQEPAAAMRLPAPSDRDHLAYLGIDGTEAFALKDIRSPIVLIEVFSMYCPHCQREAPKVNRLYRRIADDPALAGRIRVLGIGVGNTSYEVDLFRKTFDIPFPLFPDRSRQFAQRLEVRQTPTFIGFANRDDGRLQRILFNPGPIGEVEDFLNRLVQGADLAASPDA